LGFSFFSLYFSQGFSKINKKAANPGPNMPGNTRRFSARKRKEQNYGNLLAFFTHPIGACQPWQKVARQRPFPPNKHRQKPEDPYY
jgi:hypothetical protein